MLWKKGNFDGAVEQYQRALVNREEKAPNSLDLARYYDIALGLQHIITKFDDTCEDVIIASFPILSILITWRTASRAWKIVQTHDE